MIVQQEKSYLSKSNFNLKPSSCPFSSLSSQAMIHPCQVYKLLCCMTSCSHPTALTLYISSLSSPRLLASVPGVTQAKSGQAMSCEICLLLLESFENQKPSLFSWFGQDPQASSGLTSSQILKEWLPFPFATSSYHIISSVMYCFLITLHFKILTLIISYPYPIVLNFSQIYVHLGG